MVATLLAAVVAVLVPAGVPTAGAADEDRLAVTIDAMTPVALGAGDTLTVSGRVSNPSSQAWSRLRVHLVMPSVPLTDPAAVDAALAEPTAATTGTRLTSPGVVVEAGDLQPGDTTTFELEVPATELPTTSAGVYPVGVHVLATGEDGSRSRDAVGRAYTVVPYVADDPTAPTQVSMVWPFVAPIQRDARNRYVGAPTLVKSVSPGGRLRRMLDLARADESSPSTVLIDPALLDALRDIANDSYGPGRDNAPGGSAAYAPTPVADESTGSGRVQAFLSELVDYARRHTVWALPFGRPDSAALTRRTAGDDGATVVAAARSATAATLAQFDLTARIVSWSPNGITNATRINGARQLGATGFLVSPDVLPGWTPTDSTALQASVAATPADLVVVDPTLAPEASGSNPTLALRQRVASRATLAALGQGSRHLVVVPSASFDPGSEWARARFPTLFDPAWVSPVAAEAQLGGNAAAWEGRVRLPAKANQRPIDRDQVAASARIVDTGGVVSEILGDNERRDVFYQQSASLASSQDWRSARTRGVKHADDQAASVDRILDRVSVSTSSFVTLSGSSGRFPVTITNELSAPVTVGVHFTADDRSARIEDIEPQQIPAGQSVTLTVSADVGQATTTTFVATLATAEGSLFGDGAAFTLRSSVVGRIIWIFFGFALLLVVVAIARRVVKSRAAASAEDEPGSDA